MGSCELIQAGLNDPDAAAVERDQTRELPLRARYRLRAEG